ncbi:hypothetical protein AVEN_109934-1 [Araneus ventricosus]|uniref:Uncharacterized protein n=1 Tax=Araneus ventricosus TaxID=182803 RepID=A0A4Y2UCJ6_ARAVE|nr:hypothetical protein AVEN_109934-1 [Araneus ventricosus]
MEQVFLLFPPVLGDPGHDGEGGGASAAGPGGGAAGEGRLPGGAEDLRDQGGEQAEGVQEEHEDGPLRRSGRNQNTEGMEVVYFP